MTVTELLNHSRLCTLEEVRIRLERLRENRPAEYEIIENFILSCKPKATPPKP